MKPFVPFASMLLLGTLRNLRVCPADHTPPLDALKAQLAKPASESGILESSSLSLQEADGRRTLPGDAEELAD